VGKVADLGALLKVLTPAIVCAPVVTTPETVPEAG